MTNPTWGLVVLLAVSFFCLALTYALFMILEAGRDCGAVFACIVSFCGVCCLVLSAVSAGQSFHGRATADDFLRTVLLYGLGALISWISWKNPGRIRNVIDEGTSGKPQFPVISSAMVYHISGSNNDHNANEQVF